MKFKYKLGDCVKIEIDGELKEGIITARFYEEDEKEGIISYRVADLGHTFNEKREELSIIDDKDHDEFYVGKESMAEGGIPIYGRHKSTPVCVCRDRGWAYTIASLLSEAFQNWSKAQDENQELAHFLKTAIRVINMDDVEKIVGDYIDKTKENDVTAH